MRSLRLVLLVLTTSLSYAASSGSVQMFDGKPVLNQTSTLHINGQPMSVRFIAITKHSMGCVLPIGNCSTGGQSTFWMQAGDQAQNCGKWFTTILDKEKKRQTAVPYPYLQVVTTSSATLSDEGFLVFTAGSFTCSGALDWANLQ